MTSPLLTEALAAHAAGLSVLPPRQDGTKAPDADSWTARQTTPATEEEVRAWYADSRRTGLGVVCGAVSGQLEMFEFEGRAVDEGLHHAFRAACKAADLGDLLDRIQAGYVERTPSGGFHLLYRVDGTAKKTTKLARRPRTPKEWQATYTEELTRLTAEGLDQEKAERSATRAADSPLVTIETKGEGGYTITAPSHGDVHPDGAYERLGGGFDSIATITEDERDELYAVARSLDRCSRDPKGGSTRQTMASGARSPFASPATVIPPGEDYNTRDGVQDRVVGLLTDYGWTKVYEADGTAYMRRPGKSRGISATVGYNTPGQLVVFTTSTQFEEHPASYSPFGVYAELEHGGDYSAAAKALRADGYGDSGTSTSSTSTGETTSTTEAPSPPQLEFVPFGALAARVDARGPRQWLLRGLWPHGDYGIHHAAPKAQKSWNTVDLAVAVASGTPWLGHVEVDTPGPVVIFWGEGGEGNIVRRIRAAAASRDLDAAELPIYVCPRAPHLGSTEHLDEMADAIGRIAPALVILDPLYLAAKGAKLGDVYAMGEMLEGPQRICQAAGASLWVVHHDNRGDAKGAMRSSGAGPAEWGRVIVSASIKSKHTDPETRRTDVITTLDIIGGEVPDTTLRVTRRVWADDPDDLSSALHVETIVEAGDAATTTAGGTDLKPAEQKLYGALQALGTGQWTSSQLVDWIANKHGHGLRRETASRCLNHLAELDLVDSIEQANGLPTLWLLPGETRDEPVTDHGAVTALTTRDVTRDVTGVGTRDLPVTSPVGRSQVTGHTSPVTPEPVITGHGPTDVPLYDEAGQWTGGAL